MNYGTKHDGSADLSRAIKASVLQSVNWRCFSKCSCGIIQVPRSLSYLYFDVFPSLNVIAFSSVAAQLYFCLSRELPRGNSGCRTESQRVKKRLHSLAISLVS